MRYRALVILSAGLLSACQIDTSRYPESSPFKPVPVGATLILHQPLTIPADKVAVYLQNGKVLRYAEVEVLKPHCKFELYKIADKERVVHPDRFRIIKVSNNQAGFFRPTGTRLAETRIGVGIHLRMGAGGTDDGSPSMVTYMTEIRLQSANQPDVFKLSCGRLDDPGAEFLSIEEMRKALGDVFTLKTAEAS